MQFNTLFFVVLLSFVCFALTQGSFDDCCLKYVKEIKQHNLKHVKNYKLQMADGGCNLPAVILTMKKGRKLCANPKEKWVQGLLVKLDENKKRKHHQPPSKRG
ncbi:C-C motif chemokine 20 [Melanotaenia boesemani]|uniref:C-C motif chemokine 20 n=1 Tax=Melanotaenia boesemani TaxID=1250792 RepID=UPI001C055A4C|nr:C-C motif chemokine 20 [Melanotaenia boesemani]